MSVQLLQQAWQAKLPCGQKMVLLCLATMATNAGEAWPPLDLLATRCGMARAEVIVALDELDAEGYVACSPGQPGGMLYRLYPELGEG